MLSVPLIAGALLVAPAIVIPMTASATPNHIECHDTLPSRILSRDVDVFPHSGDYTSWNSTFLVGSLKHGVVSAIGLDGNVRRVVDDRDLVSVQAVRVDQARGRVLVSDADYGLADRSDKDNPFLVAGVGSYDLSTGRRHWYVDLAALLADGK